MTVYYNMKIVVTTDLGETEHSWQIDKEQLQQFLELIEKYQTTGPSGKDHPLGATIHIDAKTKPEILF